MIIKSGTKIKAFGQKCVIDHIEVSTNHLYFYLTHPIVVDDMRYTADYVKLENIDLFFCEQCDSDLEEVKGDGIYEVDQLICSNCDSTYSLEHIYITAEQKIGYIDKNIKPFPPEPPEDRILREGEPPRKPKNQKQ